MYMHPKAQITINQFVEDFMACTPNYCANESLTAFPAIVKVDGNGLFATIFLYLPEAD